MPGGPDMAFVPGGEHFDLRPKDPPQRKKPIYAAPGKITRYLC